MSEKTNADVFVSYSSKNKNVADAIVAEFEKNGIRCWYAPRDIMPGESWVSAITDALQSVKVQVLVYTAESNASRQVMNEVAVAFNAGKTIVPFRLTEEKMSSEFEYYLSRVHWLDAMASPLNDNISQLRQYVEVILSGVDKVYAAGAGTAVPPVQPVPSVQSAPKRKPLALGLIIGICAALLVLVPVIVLLSARALYSGYDARPTEVVLKDGTDREVVIKTEPEDGAADEEVAENQATEDKSSEDMTADGDTTEDKETDVDTAEAGNAEDQSPDDETAENTSDTKEADDTAAESTEGTENADSKDNTVDTDKTDKDDKTSDSSQKSSDAGEATENDNKDKADNAEEKDVSDMTVEELERAAKKGDVAACDELGAMYYDGEGVDQDYGKALLYLSRADENKTKSAETYKRLGDMYYYGKGVDLSDETAGKYYGKAVDLGIKDAGVWSNYGMVLYRDDRFADSAKYFANAAKSDKDPMTMYNAGLAYYGAEDYDNALTWFGKAIDSGYSRPDDARSQIRSMVDAGLVSEKAAKKWL